MEPVIKQAADASADRQDLSRLKFPQFTLPGAVEVRAVGAATASCRATQEDRSRVLPHALLPPAALASARRVLQINGNKSSPTVLFVLKETLDSKPIPGPEILASFGAGFSAHGALLEFP